MLWLLLLHISAVVCWFGSLLYLPALIADNASEPTGFERERQQSLTFTIYRLFSTPAALIAIASGTALFTAGGITHHWLILKLTLVVALVLCHALIGLLILITQKSPDKNKSFFCVALQMVLVILIPMIIWTVLTKPL